MKINLSKKVMESVSSVNESVGTGPYVVLHFADIKEGRRSVSQLQKLGLKVDDYRVTDATNMEGDDVPMLEVTGDLLVDPNEFSKNLIPIAKRSKSTDEYGDGNLAIEFSIYSSGWGPMTSPDLQVLVTDTGSIDKF